jgi:AcrR family transcriptional regulator
MPAPSTKPTSPTDATPEAPVKRKRLTGPQRRATFLDAAATIIAARGAEALTMEGVAAELGVNKALGYRYFTNRDDLLVALYDRESDRFDQRIIDAIDPGASFEDKLRAIVTVYLEAVAEGSVFMTQFESSPSWQGIVGERRAQREAATLEYLAGLIRSERPMDKRTAFTAAAILASGSQGLVALQRATTWSRPKLVDTFITMSLGALDSLVPRD